ncbi:uncharacterized protein LOC133064284 isoform X2 [Dama dama]|uniref:uncharacterized protein LOC133064284 isoform X2 n=1 Tax=Dama dama TaxID=30532 RepID=UPI002A36941B|nr:uncharacterized protein LOC133064284 isoform X2 [Dama dama]
MRVWLEGDLPATRPPPGRASLQSPAGEGLPLRGRKGDFRRRGWREDSSRAWGPPHNPCRCSRWLLHAWVAAGSPREEHLIPLRLQPRLVALSTQPLDLGARPSPLPEPTLPLSDLRAARNQRNSSLIKHHLPQAVDGSVISRV